jgi:hypothetical protein
MPSVTLPRADITAQEATAALSKQLGSRYQVAEKAGKPGVLKVSTGAMSYANVHLSPRSEGTHFAVHGGGFILGRVINELLIARTVAKAIRESPDLSGGSSTA